MVTIANGRQLLIWVSAQEFRIRMMSVVLETRRVKFNKRRGVCKSWRPESPLQNTRSIRKRPEKPSEFSDFRVSFVVPL